MSDSNDTPSEVNAKDKSSISKPKRNIKLYIIIFILLLFLILSIAIGILLFLKDNSNTNLLNNSDTTENKAQEENNDQKESSDTQIAKTQDCPEPEECPTVTQYPKHDLSLVSGGHIVIPDSWYVKSAYIKNRILTDDEQDDYLNPANHGYWPIYEGFSLVISNNKATITFGEESDLIPGGVGFTLQPIDSSWKIVREPVVKASDLSGVTDRSDFGYAYKSDAGVDIYTIIAEDDTFGGDYVDINIGPRRFEYKFKGDSRYRDVANEIFYKSCVLNSSKLCD